MHLNHTVKSLYTNKDFSNTEPQNSLDFQNYLYRFLIPVNLVIWMFNTSYLTIISNYLLKTITLNLKWPQAKQLINTQIRLLTNAYEEYVADNPHAFLLHSAQIVSSQHVYYLFLMNSFTEYEALGQWRNQFLGSVQVFKHDVVPVANFQYHISTVFSDFH